GDPVDNRDVLITDNVVFNDTWDYSPATHGYPISLIIEPVGLSVELYGGGNRLADETAQIVAGAAFGYEFDQWLGTPEDIALLDNPYSPSANFVMPPREVSFTANYIAATGYDLLFTITDETPEPLEMVEVNLRYRGTGGKTKDTSSRKNSVERQLVNDPVSNNVEPAAITESVFEESLMLDDKGMVVDVLPDKKVGRSESKNSKSCAFNYDMFVGAVRIITDSNEEVISKTDYLAGLPTDYGFDMPGGGTAVNLYGLVIYDLFFPGSQVKVWVNKDYSWLYVPNQTILDSWESYGAVYLENTYNEFVDFCGYEISFNTTPTVNAGHYGDHNFRILPYGLTTIYTDPSGLASVNTPGGDYFYSVRLPGYQSQSSNTTLSTSTNIPVTLVEIFEGGTGAIDDPFLIATAEQLNSVRDFTGYEYVDVYFKQIADINLGVSPWIDAEGWDPIGYQSSPFTAKYNGNYHSITGLTINRPEQQQVGLFGWVSSATLKNLAVSNVNVNGSWRVGALAGHIEGNTIVDSVSTAGAISGSVHVGGLVGRVWDSSVSNSYSQVNVTQVVGDVTQQAAGLVGRLYNGSIQSCFATGNVSGAPTGYWNGGLVSVNSAGSSISNSYSTGDVSGYLYLGGLVAAIQDTSSIVNCYSVSYVADSLNSGGLVGIAYDDIYVVENSYWNYETSCQSKSGAGEGKSTIEMITQTTFSAWDFANVWNITDGVTYPYLRHQSEIGTFNYPIELIPPTNLTVIGGNGSVSLSWNAPSYGTPTGYKIYRDGSLVYTASNAEL
ncbi:MAG TPA: GLUG motif-containing protein, partial [Tenuifilaceae bacterium]|nr:GLUG motif-containing protein [Tenuifilaceae bacterium]